MKLQRAIGLILIGLSAACAFLAPWLATHDPFQSSIDMFEPPSPLHLMGTDDLGRDLYSRLVYGSRTSLFIGIGGALMASVIGIPLGIMAGYLGGKADLLLSQLIDLFIALPGLVLALIITAMVGPSIKNLMLVLGFVMWPTVARIVRGQVLALRETLFVEAAVALGGGAVWIMHRHILPNILRIVAAQFAITASFAIFTSASLSFLGLGVPPPTPDWGGMVREGFQYLALNPLMSLAPGAAVGLTVLGFYLLGSTVE